MLFGPMAPISMKLNALNSYEFKKWVNLGLAKNGMENS